MLDNYSYFPAPNREDAIQEVIAMCKHKYIGQEMKLKEITGRIITEMPSLGSYTGWHVEFKHDAIKMVHEKMNLC
jgi:hypothetical protein